VRRLKVKLHEVSFFPDRDPKNIAGAQMRKERNRICPVELAPSLDSRLRRLLQNPHDILAPFVREGMTVLDIGCGPGYFSIEMAGLVGAGGKVISADLQEGMLAELRNKIKGSPLEPRIKFVLCSKGDINVSVAVDFILAFYMVHEVPDKNALFKQLRAVLRQEGQILLVEPKFFHVSRAEWRKTTAVATANAFRVNQGPKLRFSWSAVLKHA
jgi:SAM-dependent methyltransferase